MQIEIARSYRSLQSVISYASYAIHERPWTGGRGNPESPHNAPRAALTQLTRPEQALEDASLPAHAGPVPEGRPGADQREHPEVRPEVLGPSAHA